VSRGPSTPEIWNSAERAKILRRDADRDQESSREETEVLIAVSGIVPGLRVLDVGCGPGIPTLELARTVGAGGKVVGVDISERVLEVARERAQRAGVSNAEFQVANVEHLPFPDAHFDRVVSRFGIMFVEDLSKGLRELFRVIQPGGRVGLMVWGSFDQPYMQGTVGVLLRHLQLAEPPPEGLRPFRFAEPGSLEGPMTQAGFVQVTGKERTVNWIRQISPERARDEWREGLVFWRPLVDQLPGGESSPAWAEIADCFRGYFDGTTIRVPLTVRVVLGTRSAQETSTSEG
jgi:SAM-dependent methyltransferase